ncbi:hypothetical protein ACS7SF_27285 (plasmid) [Ralstonia sp. 25C]|uniref:hypothetical protein n=1 Tax=Ralstonia sp. 25C TaxID=3447363 RepID=UPI003F74EAC9
MNAITWTVAACRSSLRQCLAVFCMGAVLAGCGQADTQVNRDPTALRQYVRLEAPPQSVRFELATLPENNSGMGVPGPTDYVALIVAIKLPPSESARFAGKPRYVNPGPVPEAFVRTWLTEPEKAALRRTATEGGVAYNISSMTTRSTKRAIAVPVRADEWVLYIEYVAPSA